MKLFSVRYLIGRLETWPIHAMQRSLTLSMHPSVGEINVSVVQSIGVGEMVSMGLKSSTHVIFFICLILDSNVLVGPCTTSACEGLECAKYRSILLGTRYMNALR